VLDVVGATNLQPNSRKKKKNEKKNQQNNGKSYGKPTTAASNYFELCLIGGKWSQLATSWPAAPLIRCFAVAQSIVNCN